MSFDEVKCRVSPRTSQMPWSGSRQCAAACSTWREQDRPQLLGQLVPGLGVEVDGVQDRPPDVELQLVDRSVAYANGAGSLVAVQLLDDGLGKVPLAADAIHDLQVVPRRRRRG